MRKRRKTGRNKKEFFGDFLHRNNLKLIEENAILDTRCFFQNAIIDTPILDTQKRPDTRYPILDTCIVLLLIYYTYLEIKARSGQIAAGALD
ncbi:hypothetical protein L596_025818 [Steinernema carpocapsae]|uniref:Uncharacterized protein n=1 Tax=Steinernema carpocapsae TaxID=34508 RepID=A0A4U5M949_STECR|nr:hypothetical protein L596_025818 [Steinernema carpocapsae]